MTPGNFVTSQEVDLSNCDREAIQIPGSIQPHGILLALQEPQLKILQISNNTENFFGISAQSLINQDLNCLFSQSQIELISTCIFQETPELFNPIKLTVEIQEKSVAFNGMLHRYDGMLILELEPILISKETSEINFYHLIKSSILKIKKASTFGESIQLIVKEFRKITGYDRVMIYQFEPDESGIIIAEDKKEGLEPYLDLHYPASDIPQQARKLYYENWLRLIVNMDYQPAEIIPVNNPLTDAPLDLSFSLLRSVSPLHREYSKNMGVSASICISLINEQKLWGLIIGHHESPKYINYEIRKYCELLGQMMSVYIVNKQEESAEHNRKEINYIKQNLKRKTSVNPQFIGSILEQNTKSLLDLVQATGAVIYLGNESTLLGQTPPKDAIHDLLAWLLTSCRKEVFFTNSLSQLYPKAKEFKDVASGLLAISIFLNQASYHVLWFRPEVIQTVNWGGNPNKPVSVENDGSLRLSPRKSFELWKETVREKSLLWQPVEIDAALELRSTLMLAALEFSQLALQDAAEKAEIANRAKSQFLAKMSHELRTPLNAILGFTQVLTRDNGLSPEQLQNIEIINRSGEHLLELINDVLEMSKIEAGRLTLNEHSFDLYQLLDTIQERLKLKANAKGVQLIFYRMPEVPQYVTTDESKLRQVLINLLENAIKFTQQGSVRLDVKIASSQLLIANDQEKAISNEQLGITFEVEDTGSGIAPSELNTLFDPFVQTETGRQSMQGTGLGLAISRQFIRLMGGEVTIRSTLGQGSNFSFDIQIFRAKGTDVRTTSPSKRVIGLEPNQPPYRILVVEDVEENRLLLVKLLESVGFQVQSAVNGVEAVALWNDWEPHLIWMDMQMPVMDGYEATKQIKATLKGQATIIIALTAHTFSQERSGILEAGCDDFMPKLFWEEMLFEKMADQLGVQYIYEEENQPTSSQLPAQPLQVAKDVLSRMPKEWVQALSQAALELDEHQVIELIKQIPKQEDTLANILTHWVDNLRLDLIIDVAEKILTTEMNEVIGE
ncbi:MAG TPA: ATP-binding protein [Coleofasciculaceae cyanobacterium]|jgi:light-regulated signal transduction histidine kinase (bacteriophytochrome)/DNA-binding response OmpR family regulator